MWAPVAGAGREHADYADARGAQSAERMLELAQVGAGDRVLELACGPGGLGLAAAERVGPGGEVVLTDVAEEMTAIAAARGAARWAWATSPSAALDLERIDEPDAAYDVVLCREGLMFALEPARAVGEIRRVLRPGGRVAVAVWGPRERNPWLGLVMDVVSAQHRGAGAAARHPRPVRARRRRRAAPPARRRRPGRRARRASSRCRCAAASFDEWWERTSALAGPLSAILAALPDPAVQALRERARDAVRDYETASGRARPPGRGADRLGPALLAGGDVLNGISAGKAVADGVALASASRWSNVGPAPAEGAKTDVRRVVARLRLRGRSSNVGPAPSEGGNTDVRRAPPAPGRRTSVLPLLRGKTDVRRDRPAPRQPPARRSPADSFPLGDAVQCPPRTPRAGRRG